ncbi:MAG: hypothetical protein CVT48_00860 [Thermoplasmata archaeon HGW-Thermoplasmata-1]|nr:MAG: hypothetical protein CVT48_00860 [Thermoplasmata archaeon HGW-Thermoplasmata-1]
MEEPLCSIEISKEGDEFVGILFTENEAAKEFRNENVEILLRDIVMDIELTFEELMKRPSGHMLDETEEDTYHYQ